MRYASLLTAKRLATLAIAALIIAVGYIIFGAFRGGSSEKLLAPDTPPGEYLYLDGDRVHSYLGQLLDGLPDSEKRTLADSANLSAEVKAGGAGLSSTQQHSTTTETQVAPTVADRFYLLLRLVRAGKSRDDSGQVRDWLFDLGAQTGPHRNIYDAACKLREGDFVRIRNAHLFLSPYAAILPKANYALLNLSPSRKVVSPPTQRLLSPRTRSQRRAVNRYLGLLGKEPRLPFIVPTLSADPGRGQPAGVTFFVPVRYDNLRNEPSLISGTLTIVGKVVYRNLGRRDSRGGRSDCGRPLAANVPSSYVDRLSVTTFVPALEDAPPFVANNLQFSEGTIAGQVTANMTVAAPVVVVVPIAMYQ